MGVKKSPHPYEYDSDYLHEWGHYGLTFDKLTSFDPEGTSKKQTYLMNNVPHVTSMLRKGFKPDDFNSLQTEIPLPMYATAWEHGIHPSVLNKAYFVGSLRPEDLQSAKSESEKKIIRQQNRIFPTIDENSSSSYRDIIPGNMGHFLSSLISGATPEEALDAHRTLLPYATIKNRYFGDDPDEIRSCTPLDEYSKFRKSGGTHSEFKQLFSAISLSHSRKGIKQSNPIARNSLRSILSNYSDYRNMGLNHLEAGKAVSKFSEGTSPLMVSGDENFRKAIKNGATSDEYWDAHDKKLDMKKYAEDRKTKSHEKALQKGVFDISSLL
jgi:hypothetical protein